jgi:3-hydroxyisobutyrate dehydrogenase-like beta-hydroxyacid dehydrogenase
MYNKACLSGIPANKATVRTPAEPARRGPVPAAPGTRRGPPPVAPDPGAADLQGHYEMTADATLTPAVAVLGTGTMGAAMARNLLRAGLPVTVWTRTAERTRPLNDLGASVARTPADRLGVSRDEFTGAIRGDPLAAGVAMAKLGKIAAEDFDPDFALQWALKDVGLTLTAATDGKDAAGTGAAGTGACEDTLPVLAAVARQWRSAEAAGLGPLDVSAARLALEPPL